LLQNLFACAPATTGGHGVPPAPQASPQLQRLRAHLGPAPSVPLLPLRSLSLSSPRGRGRGAGERHPRPSNKIIHAAGCISRWSPFLPFSPGPEDGDGEGEEPTLRLQPFPCDHIKRKTGAKPLALAASSPGEGSSGSTAAAVTAIAERFLPDLLAAAERAKAGYVSKEEEFVKLSLVAKVGKRWIARLLGDTTPSHESRGKWFQEPVA
ncbi:hypothetical protein BAE44_0022993, partial [Dichanthelium oligosanthes]